MTLTSIVNIVHIRPEFPLPSQIEYQPGPEQCTFISSIFWNRSLREVNVHISPDTLASDNIRLELSDARWRHTRPSNNLANKNQWNYLGFEKYLYETWGGPKETSSWGKIEKVSDGPLGSKKTVKKSKINWDPTRTSVRRPVRKNELSFWGRAETGGRALECYQTFS